MAIPLARNLGIDGPRLSISETPKSASSDRQQREASLLQATVPSGHGIILLDERGKNMTSRALSLLIMKYRDEGGPGLSFLIGGADGFDQSLRQGHPQVVQTLSFGAATWPHLLCRVMLAEQLYRAMTILAGHPYHRE